MRKPNHFFTWIADPKLDEQTIRRHALAENFRRGRLMAAFIFILSVVFTILVLGDLTLIIRDALPYISYLLMLGLMILFSIGYFILFSRKVDPDELPPAKLNRLETAVWLYAAFVICWGSVITLINQGLYMEMMVFSVNIVACSIIFIIEWKRLLAAYAGGVLILLIGLPYFVKDPPHLFSHYVNLGIFTMVAFLAACLIQMGYYRYLSGKLALAAANAQLTIQNRQIEKTNDQLVHANFQLHQLSLIDELTGLANRRGLRNFISQVFEQSDQPIENLAVIMLDIDNFKLYNDHYGHPVGDQVLAAIAGLLGGMTRPPKEIAARWGGEEFILLSFDSDEHALTGKAENIRRQVESLRIIHEYSPTAPIVTVSIGTSLMPVDVASDVSMVIEAADIALYAAKEEGRNQVKNGMIRNEKTHENQADKPVSAIPVDTPALAAEVARLADRIWREYYPSIIGQAQVDYMLEKFQNAQQIWQDISELGYEYSLIQYDGEPAGYMAVKINKKDKTMFLSKIYIDRKFRQLRLGRMMVDRLIENCRKNGLGSIWLTVNKNNSASITAYEKMGFIRTDSLVNDIGSGYVMDDYVMRLKLD